MTRGLWIYLLLPDELITPASTQNISVPDDDYVSDAGKKNSGWLIDDGTSTKMAGICICSYVSLISCIFLCQS